MLKVSRWTKSRMTYLVCRGPAVNQEILFLKYFWLDGFTTIPDHIHNVNYKKARRGLVWALLDHFLNATYTSLVVGFFVHLLPVEKNQIKRSGVGWTPTWFYQLLSQFSQRWLYNCETFTQTVLITVKAQTLKSGHSVMKWCGKECCKLQQAAWMKKQSEENEVYINWRLLKKKS